MGDQQGGAVVITGKTACREVLLYLERKQIPGTEERRERLDTQNCCHYRENRHLEQRRGERG
jgi:hypothetical protein